MIAAGFFGIEHFNPPWDIFFLPLFNLLIFLYELPFFDFALAIIAFTIIIRTILAPLFIRQIRSQKEMQRMQPLVREIQRKHKGNRQKVTEETMALYKEHGVNQFGGCLPVVLQLPILFALYQALIRASGVITGFTVERRQPRSVRDARGGQRHPPDRRARRTRTRSPSTARATCPRTASCRSSSRSTASSSTRSS